MCLASKMNCVNHELCEHQKVEGIGSDFCMTCGSWFKVCGFGWDALTFVDATDECVICMETCERKLMFPTNCGHSFCIPCSRNILFFDESRYHLSPVPYGCPPCPNGCINPIKGTQCGCEEYDAVKDAWASTNKKEHTKWIRDESKSFKKAEEEPTAFGNCTCPLCRKRYERNPATMVSTTAIKI
jgi:hypothetical protein